MQRVYAIALIAVRNAMRSRFLLALLAFLLLALIGLPLTVKGDGTLAGQVRLLLRYTLGLAMWILSIATVWSACASVSGEIRDRTAQMIVGKPVRPLDLWLGKWLGVLWMNGALLLLCTGITYLAVQWTVAADQWSDAERAELQTHVLVAQRHLRPRQTDQRTEIQQQLQALRERGEWPPEQSEAEVRTEIERTLRHREQTVAPGATRRWVFDLPRTPPADRPLRLRYRFAVSVLDLEPVQGRWQAGDPAAPSRFRQDVEDPPRTWHTLTIPGEWIAADGTLTLEFANLNERPVIALFDPARDLRLLVYEGGFTGNFLRAVWLLLLHLAFLGAIGITAGSYFSLPVAALTSFYALLMVQAAHVIGQIAGSAARPLQAPGAGGLSELFAVATAALHAGIYHVVRPVAGTNPLDRVAGGEWISWTESGLALLIKIGLYSGVLLVLGVWHLSRKEVALPS
jgi:hypothetical protein